MEGNSDADCVPFSAVVPITDNGTLAVCSIYLGGGWYTNPEHPARSSKSVTEAKNIKK